jgi:hypothetical protein
VRRQHAAITEDALRIGTQCRCREGPRQIRMHHRSSTIPNRVIQLEEQLVITLI